MDWLIALGVLVLLGCLPLGISIVYDVTGPVANLLAGPLRITLYPRKKKEKAKTVKQDKTNKTVKQEKTSPVEKKGGSYTDFLPLVRMVAELLVDFRRKLQIKRLEMLLCMAGGDPCDLGINYGRAWAAVGNLMPQLERLFVIKKRDIQVQCDFTGSKTTIYVWADITITLGRLIGLVFRYGWRALKEYLKITNKGKGGAK